MAVRGKLFLIVAPTGTGKTTLVQAVLKKITVCPIERVITYTSRTPRAEEIGGRDYHFVSAEEFKRKIHEGFFLEWSTAYGEYYGTPQSLIQLLYEGKSFIAIVDKNGADALRAAYCESVLIRINPPSLEEVTERLLKRNQTKEEEAFRIKKAAAEINDDCSAFDYVFVNDDFTHSLELLQEIINSKFV